jgi:hypothetical protein
MEIIANIPIWLLVHQTVLFILMVVAPATMLQLVLTVSSAAKALALEMEILFTIHQTIKHHAFVMNNFWAVIAISQ